MKLAETPDGAEGPLRRGLDIYRSGLGRDRMRSWTAEVEPPALRGTLPTAQVALEELDGFLEARGADLDRYFTTFQAFLTVGDRVTGLASATRDGNTGWRFQEVSTGADRLHRALTEVETWSDTRDWELRLVEVPELYLTAVALIGDEEAAFRVLTPPYSEHVGRKNREQFRSFANELREEHRRIFHAEG